jgi:hypothetical protein
MGDALGIAGVLFTVIAIPWGFYKLCLIVVDGISKGAPSRGLKWIGCALVAIGLVEMQLAAGLFAWSGPNAPPLWLEVLGGVGFWGWWAFLLAGLACLERP